MFSNSSNKKIIKIINPVNTLCTLRLHDIINQRVTSHTMKHCILLIEDNDVIRENTMEILELSDFEVLAASGGIKGLELLQIKKPDLILCDILMPEMNGYQFFQAIQQDHDVSSIPFIFLTAYSEKKDVEEALSMGAQDYIVKPFDADDLVALVRKYLPELIQGQ